MTATYRLKPILDAVIILSSSNEL